MAIRTFIYLPLLSLLSIVGLLVLQSGCGIEERVNQDIAARNLKAIGDAVDSYEAKAKASSATGLQESTDDQSAEGSQSKTKPDSESKTELGSQSKTEPDSKSESDPESKSETDSKSETKSDQAEKELAKPTIEIGDNWTRLSDEREVWIDKKAKKVMFAGRVCLNDGQLEMFICPRGTKEHESVISASAQSSEIHLALLLIDCKPGKTSAWHPEYRPAHGPSIEAMIKWRDEKSGKTKSMNAKQWIRDVDTGKAMTQRWIFGGSEFWKDPDTGEEVYYGNSGELICLSNFSTATIDVDVKSSQANDGLLFEAFTENIPPVDTKVYTILTPGEIVKPEVKPKKEKEEKKAVSYTHLTLPTKRIV